MPSRDRDEALEVVAVDADRQVLQLLQRREALDGLGLRDREIGEELVGLDLRVLLEELELARERPVHEDVAGARRQLEAAVAERERLLHHVHESRRSGMPTVGVDFFVYAQNLHFRLQALLVSMWKSDRSFWMNWRPSAWFTPISRRISRFLR